MDLKITTARGQKTLQQVLKTLPRLAKDYQTPAEFWFMAGGDRRPKKDRYEIIFVKVNNDGAGRLTGQLRKNIRILMMEANTGNILFRPTKGGDYLIHTVN